MLSLLITLLLSNNVHALDFSTIRNCSGSYGGSDVLVKFDNGKMKIDFTGDRGSLGAYTLTYKISDEVKEDASYQGRKLFSNPVSVTAILTDKQKLVGKGTLKKINVFVNDGYFKKEIFLSGKTDKMKSFYVSLHCKQKNWMDD